MKILMMTNTYLPHLGGVALSVDAFSRQLRSLGHKVLIVAPEFENQPEDESDVFRIPAIQHFNGSDFSVRLPLPIELSARIDKFKPDIVHSHHSFLMGDSALRIASIRQIPIVFTHHTMYENYTHYVPGDSLAMQKYVIDLTTSYANLCDSIIAPSKSVKNILEKRGILKPINVIPTGVDTERFARGNGERFRKSLSIKKDTFVVGHVGRLAPEKNLEFLSKAVGAFLLSNPKAVFVVIGTGPSSDSMKRFFEQNNIADRLFLVGNKRGQDLVDAYHSMDIFAFSSYSETQGMVLTEAMASGLPVVALDAPGVDDIAVSGENSYLLSKQNKEEFSNALSYFSNLSPESRRKISAVARESALDVSIENTTGKLVELYEKLLTDDVDARLQHEDSKWLSAMHLIEREWKLWSNRAHALGYALTGWGDQRKANS